MNFISQTFNSKLNYDPKSPACERILSPRGNSSPMVEICSSLKSKMFTKVKECKDAIRSAVAFGKMSIKSNESGTPISTLPDVVAFSVVAGNSEEGEVLFNSTFSSPEIERMNTSIGRIDDFNEMDSSFNLSLSTDDSLKSFLEHEKQVTEEFPEEAVTRSVMKKKISAEPLFFYSDDTDESFSNSLNCSHTLDIALEGPQMNSMFSDSFDESNKPGSSNAQDSDYENHVSM
nr:uncharacterized protein LOC117219699 [Megalopta genalis]